MQHSKFVHLLDTSGCCLSHNNTSWRAIGVRFQIKVVAVDNPVREPITNFEQYVISFFFELSGVRWEAIPLGKKRHWNRADWLHFWRETKSFGQRSKLFEWPDPFLSLPSFIRSLNINKCQFGIADEHTFTHQISACGFCVLVRFQCCLNGYSSTGLRVLGHGAL